VPRPTRGRAVRDAARPGRRRERARRALARLAGSLRALYRLPLPADLAARVADAARGHARARLRIDVVPGEAPAVAVTELAEPAPAVLRPVVLPGGLGPHKWRDRTLLETHEADDPATLPLLLDADGHVLETSRRAWWRRPRTAHCTRRRPTGGSSRA
jgi:para-aminobenzoate synthetase/4-amino-4-deoxychorismate lyase